MANPELFAQNGCASCAAAAIIRAYAWNIGTRKGLIAGRLLDTTSGTIQVLTLTEAVGPEARRGTQGRWGLSYDEDAEPSTEELIPELANEAGKRYIPTMGIHVILEESNPNKQSFSLYNNNTIDKAADAGGGGGGVNETATEDELELLALLDILQPIRHWFDEMASNMAS